MFRGTILYEKAKRYQAKQHRTNAIAKSISLPRIVVSRSLMHISAQLIDGTWHVVVSVNDATLQWTKKEKAFAVGKLLAERALQSWVTTVQFDRNGYLYHGRVAELAQWARAWWLTF